MFFVRGGFRINVKEKQLDELFGIFENILSSVFDNLNEMLHFSANKDSLVTVEEKNRLRPSRKARLLIFF